MSEQTFSWRNHILAIVPSVLILSQIVMGLYLLSVVSQIEELAYVGVGLYVFSGLILGTLPIFELRRRGGVGNGQGYTHTTKVVDTGIYSIVRHPQYITFIMWAIAGMLLFQHWIVILLGLPIIPLTYMDLIREDKACIEKFGDDYIAYMHKVPRANFILGIVRRLKKID
jgi:protein-S-isoprenylcysteine O-methyltransferase Ste14